MKYSANQAAKATGVSVPTITRAIKNGKLSADKDGKTLVIDAAELFRVFPQVKQDIENVIGENHNNLQHETPTSYNNSELLQREVDLLRERLQDKDAVIQDLRTDRDHWRDLAETTTKLLPAPTDTNTRPWWKARIW